jgi:hypothetical protein
MTVLKVASGYILTEPIKNIIKREVNKISENKEYFLLSGIYNACEFEPPHS